LARIADQPAPTLPQAPSTRGDLGAGSRWLRRADALVAALILIVLGALAIPWLASQWERQRRAACATNLMKFWRSLEAYSDHHDGQYPRIAEEPPVNFAGSFISSLNSADVLPRNEVSVLCPAQGRRPPSRVTLDDLHKYYENPGLCELQSITRDLGGTYAYSLGYWEGQVLCGLHRTDTMLPIMADRPSLKGGNSPNHGGAGQNVLFVGGYVIWHTTTAAGPDGDDIYCNRDNEVLAGFDRTDAVLGSSHATPVHAD